MTLRRPFGPILLSSFFSLWVWGSAIADDGLRERLERLRNQNPSTVLDVPLASARLLDDFYRRRDFRFAWHSDGQIEDLLRLAEESVDEGLQPSDFHTQEINKIVGGLTLSNLPHSTRVDADILLTDSLLRFIHHRRYGKVDPRRLDKKWNHVEGPYATTLVEDLERVVAADDLQIEFEGLTSRSAFYTRLKEGLARYRNIVAAGGWPAVPGGKLLRPGAIDSRVPIVRERLRATGDFKGPASDRQRYDEELATAVRAFQERHYLAVDAVVGPATRAAMNIPADKRVAQIRVNLERMRWISDGLPDDFLLVDIAAQEIRLLRGEEVVWNSRVIVGRPARPTPVFRDQIEYLEINPTWTVPPTILRKDILPAMRKNPGYLKKKGLQVVNRKGKRVSPGSVNWHASAANFPYMIRQPPGSRNALGQIKFMFPNRYSVYLHDTPNRSLFKRPRRLYSSGCVRVERPWELAELVLNDPKHWNENTFKKVVASRQSLRVDLEEPLPVVVGYWTAEAGANGEVVFREDVYSRDAAVLSALDGHAPIRIVFQEPNEAEPAVLTRPEDQNASTPVTEPKTMFSRNP